MLAYVFWHWKDPLIATLTYEASLIRFHETLRAYPSDGFCSSQILRIEGVPGWLPTRDTIVYEDWYLLENSAALDGLDQAAIGPACREAHDQVARQASGGTGGLYRLHTGQLGSGNAQFACWFAKPAGMTYQACYEQILPLLEQAGGVLWQRQMTMGPALEFCWHGPVELALPAAFHPLRFPVEAVWEG